MISFILSYSETDKYRRRNIDFVINYLLHLKLEKEIIVVEQGEGEERKYYNDLVDVIYIRKPGLFHKSLLYNTGVKYSKGNILFFHDIDLFMPPEFYISALKEIKKYEAVDPYREILYYGEKDSSNILRLEKDSGLKPFQVLKSGVISGGCFVIRKDVFNKLEGFDERCIGYGHEDDIFDIKMKLSQVKIKYNWENYCIHLYHPCQKNENLNYGLYLAYKKIMDEHGLDSKN